MNLAVCLVKKKIWEKVHRHELSSLCWSAVKLPSEGSQGTMLPYTGRIVESFSWAVFIAAVFERSSLKRLCLAFPHSLLVPFMSSCTDSSVWQVPGMGAHSCVAGICQPLGWNLSRGWLAWIPQAPNVHLARQLVNLSWLIPQVALRTQKFNIIENLKTLNWWDMKYLWLIIFKSNSGLPP